MIWHAAKASLCGIVAAAFFAGASAAIVGPPRDPGYDRRLEATLFYRLPDGFAAIQQAGGVAVFQADSTGGEAVPLILLTPEVAVAPNLRGRENQAKRADFARSIVQALGRSLLGDPSALAQEEAAPRPPRAEPVEVRSFAVSTGKGGIEVRRITARILFDGAAFHLLLVTDPRPETAIGKAFESLYGSLGFSRLGDPEPRKLAPPLPSALAATTSTAPSANALHRPSSRPIAPATTRGNARCRIVQRQQCSGGIGTSLGYFCISAPLDVSDRFPPHFPLGSGRL